MSKHVLLVFVLALCGITGMARATDPAAPPGSSGTVLLRECSAAVRYLDSRHMGSATQAQEGAFCLGLVQGVVNTNQIYQEVMKERSLFCVPPSGINNEQAARIVTKYLQEHPNKLHEVDIFLVVDALHSAFPCSG